MVRSGWLVGPALLALVVGAGCSGNSKADDAEKPVKPPEAPRAREADEKLVRDQFAKLQAVLREGDAAKIWALLSEQSRKDAGKAAAKLKAEYEKANPEERAELEKV